MRIALLINEYPLTALGPCGGIGTSAKALAEGLVAKGHEVAVFGWRPQALQTQVAGVQICMVEQPKGVMAFWKQGKRMSKALADYKPDIVEVPDWSGLGAFVRVPGKKVIRLHGSDAYFCCEENRTQSRSNYFLEKRNMKKASAWIGVSKYVLEKSKKLFPSPPTQVVIHNGVEAQVALDNNKQAGKAILYFGTLVRKKGVLELPKIMKKIWALDPEVKLHLAGSDAKDWKTQSSTWSLMKGQWSETELSMVEYHGKLNAKSLEGLMNQVSAAVFPSQAEAFPMAWLECLAKGLPMVGSDKPWARELIESGSNGFLVADSNHEAYAKHLIDIIKNQGLRQQLIEKGKESVQAFALEPWIQSNETFYIKLLS